MKKASLLRLARVLMLLPCLIFLVNCSKSSKDNNNNNQCYTNSYGQYVCNNNGYNTGYRWNGSQCLNQNNQPVNVPYQQCMSGSGYYGGNGNYGGNGSCDGIYYSQQYGQNVCCGSACLQYHNQYGNCSGLVLTNQNGQQQTCY